MQPKRIAYSEKPAKESRTHLTKDKQGIEVQLLRPQNAALLNSFLEEILDAVEGKSDEAVQSIAAHTGMCRRIAAIRITAILLDALREKLAEECAYALVGGDSWQSVAKAAYKDASNLMRVDTFLGGRIAELLAEHAAEQADEI